MKAVIATILYALLIASPLGAQATSLQKQVKVARDSILCTGSASQRQKRACVRLDSIVAAPAPVALSAHYASGIPGQPAANADTVTVCGLIHFPDHSERVVWPPVRLRFVGDSAVMINRSGNPLKQMCAMLADRNAMRDSVPVTWSIGWVTVGGTRRYLPSFVWP